MRKIFLLSILASSALSLPAFADDMGPYVTIEGGAVKQERATVYVGANQPEDTDRFNVGWEAGGALGYDFGHFRLEAEGFYDRSQLKEQDSPNGNLYRNNGSLAGHTSVYAAMGNALIGLGHWGGIKAYAGGGVGYARTKHRRILWSG